MMPTRQKQSNEESVATETDGPVAAADAVTLFDQLDLSPVTLRALKRAGFETPTPVQAAVIPLALDGYDVIGQARTGTGKTAAFGLPILDQLDPLDEEPDPQALILVPTRELSDQVAAELEKLAWGVPTEIVSLAGGKDMNRQLRRLREGVQIVVGTPGRVQDHISRRSLRTHAMWCIVLDEADRMLDIGFRPQIERILRACPQERQTLLLSATLAEDVRKLSMRYMRDPQIVDCSAQAMSVDTIDQYYFTVDPDRKTELLIQLLEREEPSQAIIFCRTRRGTDKLHRRLSQHFHNCGCIHGDLQQRARDRVLGQLRSGELRLLIATDVVGRGIDITGISHIINYDVPQDRDDYVHRVGRTGRMGREGVAYTFVCPGEGDFLTAIESRINKLLKRDRIKGFDPSPTATQAALPPEEPQEEEKPSRPRLKRGMVRRPRRGRL